MNQGKLEVVKQEMAKVNVNILGFSVLKCKEAWLLGPKGRRERRMSTFTLAISCLTTSNLP